MGLMAVTNVTYVLVPVIHVFLSCHLLYCHWLDYCVWCVLVTNVIWPSLCAHKVIKVKSIVVFSLLL